MEKRINLSGERKLDSFILVSGIIAVLCLVFAATFCLVFALWQRRENRRIQAAVDALEELLDRQHADLKEFEDLKSTRRRPVLVATEGPRQGQYAFVRFIDATDVVFYPSKDWLVGDLMVESDAKRRGFKSSGETIDRRLDFKEA